MKVAANAPAAPPAAPSAAPFRSGRWSEAPGFGVYVHIPFCLHRCHYCDFNTYEGQGALIDPYVEALVRDVATTPALPGPASSLFFGGGTPTLVDPGGIGRVIDSVRARLGLTPDAEVTIEANPETVDERVFERLLTAGCNRFSIGIQSLSDRVLAALGRTHPAEVAVRAVRAARSAGVDDLNVDLIYGSPWETSAEWIATVARAIELGPDHVSAYALTVEEGTPLATLVATGRVPDVDPDVQADRFEIARRMLGEAGFERYEISNWARPGRASRHNVLYWSAGDYKGFGAGAHSHLAGRRSWTVRLPRAYIDAVPVGTTEAGYETLDDARRASEALMLGLRLVDGVDPDGFDRRFGSAWRTAHGPALDALVADGLAVFIDGRLRVTERGTFLASEVARRIL